ANSSDDVELGTIASRGPPYQKTCTERPVGTTPGNREKANLRSCPLFQQIWPRGLDLGPLLGRQCIYVGWSAIAPIADLSAIKDGDLVGIRRRHRIAR